MSNERKRLFTATSTNQGGVPSKFRGWALWSEGDYVVGTLHSVFTSTYKGKTSNNYRIQVEDCNFTVDEGKDNDTQISPVGKILVLNPMGRLNTFMDGTKSKKPIEVGQIIDFTYGGKVTVDGEKYHQCEIKAGWPDGHPNAPKDEEQEDNSGLD